MTGCTASQDAAEAPAAAVASTNSADMAGTNDLPNPYATVAGWAKMPAGREWGSTSAVDVDPDGAHIWVAERCGANIGACVQNPNVDLILKFDAQGNLVTSFGAGLITWPHGIAVDHEGNVWVTDGRDNTTGPGVEAPPADTIVHQVHKFSPTGEHLMALGDPGGAREPGYFWQPNDVLVAPSGEIFVAEGHCNNNEQCDARVIKFDAQGNVIMQWGEFGTGPDQLMQPHGLAMDSQGRLFVADRSNNRIQIYDQQGNLLDTWYQFSRISGIYIDVNDVLYAADSESGSVNRERTGWLRGIRIGSARTGEVQYLIPDPDPSCTGTCTAEGVVADRNGVIYGAEVGPPPGRLQRYERQ
ncbi:MAG TPA: peptidyl-alpha-hydroxyglycine alpha-amidating lyase family protein [Longimicrobiaceae bacterium]|nr:peptidyl-alpha-hydroxyglycine alpha-amidating lyase family protein [Longimicrobiaceae bacterium]